MKKFFATIGLVGFLGVGSTWFISVSEYGEIKKLREECRDVVRVNRINYLIKPQREEGMVVDLEESREIMERPKRDSLLTELINERDSLKNLPEYNLKMKKYEEYQKTSKLFGRIYTYGIVLMMTGFLGWLYSSAKKWSREPIREI